MEAIDVAGFIVILVISLAMVIVAVGMCVIVIRGDDIPDIEDYDVKRNEKHK